MQECPRPEAFADDMEALFNVEAQIGAPGGIDVDKVSTVPSAARGDC